METKRLTLSSERVQRYLETANKMLDEGRSRKDFAQADEHIGAERQYFIREGLFLVALVEGARVDFDPTNHRLQYGNPARARLDEACGVEAFIDLPNRKFFQCLKWIVAELMRVGNEPETRTDGASEETHRPRVDYFDGYSLQLTPFQLAAEFFARGPTQKQIAKFSLSAGGIKRLYSLSEQKNLTVQERHEEHELLFLFRFLSMVHSRLPDSDALRHKRILDRYVTQRRPQKRPQPKEGNAL